MRTIPLISSAILAASLIQSSACTSTAFGQNFTGPKELVAAAEKARTASFKFWTGRDYPAWTTSCPIEWHKEGGGDEGGGATGMNFDRGYVQVAYMSVSGTREQVTENVIPHEVDHAVRASLVGHKITRWLDEGLAQLRESPGIQQDRGARRFTPQEHSLIWQNMNSAQYPQTGDDVITFYECGWSVSKYLLETFGTAKVLELQRASPNLYQRWHDVLGESPETTRSNWWAWSEGQDGPEASTLPDGPSVKPIVYVGLANFDCPQCEAFKDDHAVGKFNGRDVVFRMVRDGSPAYREVTQRISASQRPQPSQFPWFWSPNCNCDPRQHYGGFLNLLNWLPPPPVQRYVKTPQPARSIAERPVPQPIDLTPIPEPAPKPQQQKGPSLDAVADRIDALTSIVSQNGRGVSDSITSALNGNKSITSALKGNKSETIAEVKSLLASQSEATDSKLSGLTGLVKDVAASAAEGSPAASGGFGGLLVGGATGGTGVAVVWGIHAAMALRRRRRQREARATETADIEQPQNTQGPKGSSPDPRIEEIAGSVGGIVEYLKDRERDAVSLEQAAKALEGLVARLEIQPDGSTSETFWKDGVRLAANGGPDINVLGGPAVARAIEDYVARRHAARTGDTLREQNP